MPELIIAIREYAGWLYAVLALFAAREFHALWRSRRARKVALFGLERDAAAGRAARSFVTMFLLVTIGVGVHIVSTVVAPGLPEESAHRPRRGAVFVETPPTVDLPTDTSTPPPFTATPRPPRIVTAPPDPTEAPAGGMGAAPCRNPDLQILEPAAGAIVEPGARVVVTARLAPDQGRSYWVEIGAGSAPTTWRSIGSRRTDPVERSPIATLPDDLPAGTHVIRLVLAESSGEVLPENVCSVPVRAP